MIASWNSNRDCWETQEYDLFTSTPNIYDQPFPLNGIMRNGKIFTTDLAPPPNSDDETGLLRTPVASETGGGPVHPAVAKQKNQTLRLTGQILALTGHLKPPKLLPTPKAGDAEFGLPRTSGRPPEKATHLATRIAYDTQKGTNFWGEYATAIKRWETILDREHPPPTNPTKRGRPHLSPKFVEWMMGLPEGWVTGTTGISREEMIKMLGNGVVTPQAHAALKQMDENRHMHGSEARVT